MTTYPLATLACTIGAAGISAPPYSDIFTSLQASMQGIYGSDSYIDPDSQDGQMLAVFAKAQSDSNSATIAAYNNWSPATAQGVGLSQAVKINGIARESATYSTADITIVGQAGVPIVNGLVGDDQNLGTQWALPASVTIPSGGSITVTATCTTQGAVSAAANTLTVILNPQRGWQSAINASNASVGQPVETDATLRIRQSNSTALSALTPLQTIYGTVANLAGVTRTAIYENDGSVADANGLPGHSIAVVVEGGSATAIAQAIEQKKTPGTGTYGTTSQTVTDPAGVPITVNFFVLGYLKIYITLTITPLNGYTTTIGTYIVAALAQAINESAIGGKVYYNRLWSPANLSGSAALAAVAATSGQTMTQAQLDAMSATYDVTSLFIGTSPSPTGTSDISVSFNQVAQTQTPYITLNT